MTIEILVPTLGESVTEATVGRWMKNSGETVVVDEALVELETEKVTIEVNALAAGRLIEQRVAEGETVEVGAVLGIISEQEEATAPAPMPAAPPAAPPSDSRATQSGPEAPGGRTHSPAVRRLLEENKLAPGAIEGTGKDGRLLKGDVLLVIETGSSPPPSPSAISAPSAAAPSAAPSSDGASSASASPGVSPPVEEKAAPAGGFAPGAGSGNVGSPASRTEQRVRLTRLRKKIAERLKEAQNTAAMLTTFNEVDMSAVMGARKAFRDAFEERHGVRLGFMSFFIKACVGALTHMPLVNAAIDGDEIVYRNYYDIGVAVGTGQGLVVPVVRNAEQLSFAELETRIADLGAKARDGKLTIADLTGGTFTITNGGVFGSLLSTPILNPPQSAILGMHKIQDRPVALEGAVVIRPMMYLALSYDHRLIDGREAVSFLVRIKESIEDPRRLLLDL